MFKPDIFSIQHIRNIRSVYSTFNVRLYHIYTRLHSNYFSAQLLLNSAQSALLACLGSLLCLLAFHNPSHNQVRRQSRTQSNACARARMALALGKLNFSCTVIGLTCMPTKPEPLNLGVPVVNFPRANAILARAQALLWVRDWCGG